MSHVEHDTLWSLARGELSPPEVQAAQAHLADCPDCRVSFEDVQTATALLRDLPEAPPMPEAMARRIGAELAEAADAKAAQRFTSWWQSLFTPRFVFAAALGVVLAVTGAWLLAAPEPAAPAVATPMPQPVTPRSVIPQPEAAPKKKLQVTVASANKATANKAQVLAEGARVSTQKGGSLWMKLPDGSRAGLTSTSEVKLATLEEKQLTLDLERGNLAMVVPHRQDRVLTVRAGELEVKDLGTRFLVSRTDGRTLVAVEEGEVEVSTPTGRRVLKANRAVSWSEGKLTELPWETPPPPAPVKRAPDAVVGTPDIPATPDLPAVAPAPQQPDSIARLEEEDDDAPPPPEELAPDRTPMATDEQWEKLPPSAPRPPPSSAQPPRRAVTSTERAFSLKTLERRLRELGAIVTTPNPREAGARAIALSSEAGDCNYVVKSATSWLAEPASATARELELRRSVLRNQVYCLNKLGRHAEALEVERAIDGGY